MPKVAALAVVKAHPVVFGFVLAVAIGVIVYQIVKPKKQKKHKYSSNGAPDNDDGDDGSPRVSEMYYYDRETKSVTTDAPQPNVSDKNLRKRNVAPNSSSDTNKNHSEAKSEKKEAVSQEASSEKKEAVSQKASPEKKTAVSKEVQTESVDINQNIDNMKVLNNKNIDTAMSVNEKVEEYFLKNISDGDSTASNGESDSTNGSDDSDSTDSINKLPQKSCCKCECHTNDSNDESDSTNSIVKPVQKCNCECHTAENGSTSSLDSDTASTSWSNISFTDVNNMNKTKSSRAPSICSIDSECSSFTVLSGDSELCRGCEQNPVNTYTLPCNHRYMCADCAPRIFRLFKRCKICRTRIERIVVEE